ncbi:MAG: PD-(D/E)XK nuclease family protein [Armatimonadetes bacterium]|nr:PD-(D/E)XK nuclease family protein [Armatimonadota bacterium]MDW8122756.1 PD-(D/E)XK nuclease family protein [Armatimonadota bacterium]
MAKKIVITARDLGRTKMENFCARCFWFTYHFPLPSDHPFRSPMPGIVSTLDSYIRRVVSVTYSEKRSLPDWLANALSGMKVIDVLEPKRWEARVGDFSLVGQPDAIWKLPDDSVFIVDYKTAQLTPSQEALFPLYEAQLKAYGYLAQGNGHTVSGLALVYLQPQPYRDDPDKLLQVSSEQFTLHFDCVVKQVGSWTREEVEDMVYALGSILSQNRPPDGRDQCKGCTSLSNWLEGIDELA